MLYENLTHFLRLKKTNYQSGKEGLFMFYNLCRSSKILWSVIINSYIDICIQNEYMNSDTYKYYLVRISYYILSRIQIKYK